MKSRYVDVFDHDADAADYDAEVRNEDDPIRTGYSALLDWVAASAPAHAGARLLDLGAGTGNLGQRLGPFASLVCVDISREMNRIARAKLAARQGVSWVRADLLEYFDRPRPRFSAVLSTYAVHHLTAPEKRLLFARIAAVLEPGGTALFGDLMFENRRRRADLLAGYRAGARAGLADEIEQEFFWDLEQESRALADCGLSVQARRFSELSWGVVAGKPAG